MANEKGDNYETISNIEVKYLKDNEGKIISPVVSSESVFCPGEDAMLKDKIDAIDSKLVAASQSKAGFMSAADKTKLDGITSSADSVSFTRNQTAGTKIGTLTINGTGTDLYAPSINNLSIKIQTITGNVSWPNYTSGQNKIGNISVPSGYTYIGIIDKTVNRTEYQGSFVLNNTEVWGRAGSAGSGGTVSVTVTAIFIKGI